jgi:hypothetical protein
MQFERIRLAAAAGLSASDRGLTTLPELVKLALASSVPAFATGLRRCALDDDGVLLPGMLDRLQLAQQGEHVG